MGARKKMGKHAVGHPIIPFLIYDPEQGDSKAFNNTMTAH